MPAPHPGVVAGDAVHPASGCPARAFVRSTQSLRSWYLALFQLPVLPELLLGRTLHRILTAAGLPEDAATRYTARMREPGALTGALNWYRALPVSLLTPVPHCPVPTT